MNYSQDTRLSGYAAIILYDIRTCSYDVVVIWLAFGDHARHTPTDLLPAVFGVDNHDWAATYATELKAWWWQRDAR